MKARTLIPTEVLDAIDPEGIPIFRVEAAGFVVDHPDCHWLVRNGVAEPADEECQQACAKYWNPTSKEFLRANYDQICCAHTTGKSLYDSATGDPEALERMKKRLQSKRIAVNSDDPQDVMKKHLKLVKQLKVEANERLKRQNQVKVPPKVQDGQDSGRRADDSNAVSH